MIGADAEGRRVIRAKISAKADQGGLDFVKAQDAQFRSLSSCKSDHRNVFLEWNKTTEEPYLHTICDIDRQKMKGDHV